MTGWRAAWRVRVRNSPVITTPEDLHKAHELLQAWRALVENEAYRTKLHPRLVKAKADALDGLRARGKSAVECAEHKEASHLAEELEGMARNEIERLQKDLREHQVKAGRQSGDPLDY